MYVDSHCHLDFPDFAEELPTIVERANTAGVTRMVTIGTRLSRFPGVLAVAERFDCVFASVGVHPHEADTEGLSTPDPLLDLARHPKVVGIGETGLDFYYEHSKRDAQEESFRTHIAASRELQLPLIVHTRDAEDDTVRILEEEMGKGTFPLLIHCFTSSQWLAERCLALGAYISLSGILTFKRAEDLRATAASVAMDRLLIETDAPYLAPVPYRGKRNEPAFVAHTAKCLAEVKGVPVEEIAAQTTANFERLFTRAVLAPSAAPEPAA